MAHVEGLAGRTRLQMTVVTETYPPEVNGVAHTLSRMLAGLRDRGHDIQLVRLRQHFDDLPAQVPGFEEVVMPGVPIPRYPHLRMGLPCTRALTRLWSRRRPDVVHVATEGPLGWSAVRAARRLQLPVVSDFRTNFHAYSHHYGIGWLRAPIVGYLRRFHNGTDATMVPTAGLRDQLRRQGFAGLEVVARGVDTAQFEPARRSEALRRQWGARPGTVVVQCVSRLAAEKNIALVWDAFRAIRRTAEDVRLVLVGDGPQRAELERLCAGAHFAGMRRGDDLAAHYASADLFLFPSRTETFGNVVPEAMASGVPVVAFNEAAAAQLVQPGVSGLLADSARPGQFIELAVRAASEPRALRNMGYQARASAQRLAWSRVIEDLEAVLLRACAARDTAQGPLSLRPANV
jgi:glycosyltransferase involved in cell wall biosynthesis